MKLLLLSLKVLSINEEGLRRCEENTKVFGRPIRYPRSLSGSHGLKLWERVRSEPGRKRDL